MAKTKRCCALTLKDCRRCKRDDDVFLFLCQFHRRLWRDKLWSRTNKWILGSLAGLLTIVGVLYQLGGPEPATENSLRDAETQLLSGQSSIEQRIETTEASSLLRDNQHSFKQEQIWEKLSEIASVRHEDAENTKEHLTALYDELRVMRNDFDLKMNQSEDSQHDVILAKLADATLLNADGEFENALRTLTQHDEDSVADGATDDRGFDSREKTSIAVEVLRARANAYFGLNELEPAHIRFEQILQFRPTDSRVRNAAAMCAAAMGKSNVASTHFAILIRRHELLLKEGGHEFLRPRVASLFANRATHRSRMGETKKAIADYDRSIAEFERVIDSSPDKIRYKYAVTRANKALCLSSEGRYSDAIQEGQIAITVLEELVASHSTPAWSQRLALCHWNRGAFLEQNNQLAEAIGEFESSVRLLAPSVDESSHSQINGILISQLKRLADLYLSNSASGERDIDRALKHATDACRLTNYEDWSSLRLLASVRAAKGDEAQARRIQEEAITLAPAEQVEGLRRQLRSIGGD